MKTINKYHIIALFVFSTSLLLLSFKQVSAFTMSDSNWILQDENTDLFSIPIQKTGSRQKDPDSAPGVSTGTNYTVSTLYPYMYSQNTVNSSKPENIFFSFLISPVFIDFGLLSPTNPISRTSNLTVTSNKVPGYTVSVIENRPLTVRKTQAVIPDTTCDDGACSPDIPSLWQNTLTYGFGYRCDNQNGNSCDIQFASTDYYKPFPSTNNNNTPQIVMYNTKSMNGDTNTSQITYKLNISGTQTQGLYENIVTFIAAPSY